MDEAKKDVPFKYYDLITVLFVAVLLISNVATSKIAQFGPLSLSAAIILFPISYIFGDILTEVYGYARSRRTVWLGFFCAALAAFVYWVVGLMPPAPGWENQEAYMKILGIVPRIVLGSLLAYWAGEFVNSFVLAKMKIFTKGRYLWSRTIGSTMAGELVDTIIVMAVAFYGVLPNFLLIQVAINIYWVKVLYEIIATPFTYWIVNFLKKAEGIDYYDYHTNFTPFKVVLEEPKA